MCWPHIVLSFDNGNVVAVGDDDYHNTTNNKQIKDKQIKTTKVHVQVIY